MLTRTHLYTSESGWNPPLQPALDSSSTLVLALGSRSMESHPELFAELRRTFPLSTLAGCSTAGEIFGHTLHDESIVLAVARFEHSQLSSSSVSADLDGLEAGRLLAEALPPDTLRAVLVLSDGSRVNGSRLVHGLEQHLPPGVVISGGFAGDGTRFESTWVLDEDVPTQGRIVVIGLHGPRLSVAHGSHGGWSRFGPERLVTRSENNVLFELDGRPALQLYKEYLGERQRDLPSAALVFPLWVREANERTYVRTILAVDEASQSMTFAGDIPMGAHVQLMRGNLDRIVEGAAEAARDLGAPSPALHTRASRAVPTEGTSLCLAVTCVGRRMVLRERTEEELEAVVESLPTGTLQVGFYSYGEISPLTDGTCGLHNQTMTLTLVMES